MIPSGPFFASETGSFTAIDAPRILLATPLAYNDTVMTQGFRILSRAAAVFLSAGTLLAQASTLTPGAPAEAGMSARRLDRLDAVIESAIREGNTPGAVVLVARQGKIVFLRAYGRRMLTPEVRPMTPDTIFDMASMTKIMATAPSIMKLVEEGRLALTDRVAHYIPEFAQNGKGKITLLQLLTHYSGLPPDLDLKEQWSGYAKAIEMACAEQLAQPPGEKFIYSDINYIVLGEIVHRTSGQSLAEFAKSRIFEPLGMKDTKFHPEEALRSRIAPTQRRGGRLLWGEVHDPTANRMGGVAGHAGLFSTARDTAVYAQMILNGGEYAGRRILSPLGVVALSTPQTAPYQDAWRAAGFDVRSPYSTARGDLFPIGSFGHTGFTGTSLWIDPFSRTLVVLLTNRVHPDGKGSVISLRKKVASIVAGSILKLPRWQELYHFGPR